MRWVHWVEFQFRKPFLLMLARKHLRVLPILREIHLRNKDTFEYITVSGVRTYTISSRIESEDENNVRITDTPLSLNPLWVLGFWGGDGSEAKLMIGRANVTLKNCITYRLNKGGTFKVWECAQYLPQ